VKSIARGSAFAVQSLASTRERVLDVAPLPFIKGTEFDTRRSISRRNVSGDRDSGNLPNGHHEAEVKLQI